MNNFITSTSRKEPPKFTGLMPFNYTPRSYQLPLLIALDSGCKRAIAIFHRRSGKDKTMINYVAKRMTEKVGTYYYFFPTYKQGRKVIWDGIDSDGFKFTDHFPDYWVEKRNEQEMKITLKNGSVFQIVGGDDIDSIVGTNPCFCVFSEYSIMDPSVWGYIRPILAANGGVAVFIYTPRGRGHGWDLLQYAKGDKAWFTQILTVKDTKCISEEILESERKGIIATEGDDALYFQEYFCSFDAPMQGSYYGKLLELAELSGRIGKCPYDPHLPVNTVWDIGVGDATAIWFVQIFGKEVRLIDCFEESGEGLPFYVKMLQSKPYIYKDHYAPHDIEVREFSSGVSRFETAEKLGIRFKITPKLPIEDGIDAVRGMFPYLIFDKEKCEKGLEALYAYHKEWDERKKQFKAQPFHDWSSHCCFPAGTKIQMVGGEKNIEDVRAGDLVDIDGVTGKVTMAGPVKIAQTIDIHFSSGVILKCTPDHKIFTIRGLLYADELEYGDIVYTKQSRLWNLQNFSEVGMREGITSYIKALNIDAGKKGNYIVRKKIISLSSYIECVGKKFTGLLKGLLRSFQLIMTGSTLKLKIGQKELRDRKEISLSNMNGKSSTGINSIKSPKMGIITTIIWVNSYIVTFGNSIMEKSLKAFTSIIKTITKLIMQLKTWIFYLLRNIQNCMLKLIPGLTVRGIKSSWLRSDRKLRSGIVQRGDWNGIKHMALKLGKIKYGIQQFAKNVIGLIRRPSQQEASFVTKIVKPRHLDGEEGRTLVYDLTVEKHHCYLANGILVSNSDALRYLAVNFRYIMRSEAREKESYNTHNTFDPLEPWESI